KGRAWVNLLPLDENEKVMYCTPVSEYCEDSYIIMLTEKGVIKKTALTAYKNRRTNGTKATLIDEGDRLAAVRLCRDEDLVFIATRNGMALKFPSNTLRAQGRVTRGCIGIRFKKGVEDKVISMEVMPEEGTVLTVTENGYGKKSPIVDYRLGSRGNMGVMNIRSSERNGAVIDSVLVDDEDGIMLITQRGKIIRLPVNQIRSTGRVTQGVRLINLEDGEKVVSIAKIASDKENNNDES
ncbi:MAG: DNA gyrase subunit A, partial [Proteobacteria bacterium]|nr:DNA gyrase subunit A [Pseudomonadota bacterium]